MVCLFKPQEIDEAIVFILVKMYPSSALPIPE